MEKAHASSYADVLPRWAIVHFSAIREVPSFFIDELERRKRRRKGTGEHRAFPAIVTQPERFCTQNLALAVQLSGQSTSAWHTMADTGTA